MCHCKFNQSYRRFAARRNNLIPIFGFGSRTKKQLTNPRHWLSGKGNVANKSNQATNQNGTAANNTGVTGLQNYNQTQFGQAGHFNRHLAMNLENDMYYTVDFSESQQSPLIH